MLRDPSTSPWDGENSNKNPMVAGLHTDTYNIYSHLIDDGVDWQESGEVDAHVD